MVGRGAGHTKAGHTNGLVYAVLRAGESPSRVCLASSATSTVKAAGAQILCRDPGTQNVTIAESTGRAVGAVERRPFNGLKTAFIDGSRRSIAAINQLGFRGEIAYFETTGRSTFRRTSEVGSFWPVRPQPDVTQISSSKACSSSGVGKQMGWTVPSPMLKRPSILIRAMSS